MKLPAPLILASLLGQMVADRAKHAVAERFLSPPRPSAGVGILPKIREIPSTATSRPFMTAHPMPRGYTEREFTVEGAATYYDFVRKGSWDLKPHKTAGYRTRIVVRRPPREAFNGTVLVEWLNVTAQFDLDAEWLSLQDDLTEQGFAYVGVTLQRYGAVSLARQNPQRYAGVQIWDDGMSYDILSQIGRLVRARSQDILGDLEVRHVIAGGASQSAFRLTTYVNAFHPRDHAYDGYMLRGRGLGGAPIRGAGIINGPKPAPIREDIDVPVMVVQAECDLLSLRAAYDPQDDGPLLRIWEVAGAPHGSSEAVADIEERFAREGVAFPAGVMSGATLNCMRSNGPSAMAYRHLRHWVQTGEAPPHAPPIVRTRVPGAPPPVLGNLRLDLIGRDEFGNALGGIRLPDIDAPVGQYVPCTYRDRLGGSFRPFDSATLKRLYPTHDHYVEAVRRAADRCAEQRFISREAADAFIADAQSSPVPDGLPAFAHS